MNKMLSIPLPAGFGGTSSTMAYDAHTTYNLFDTLYTKRVYTYMSHKPPTSNGRNPLVFGLFDDRQLAVPQMSLALSVSS